LDGSGGHGASVGGLLADRVMLYVATLVDGVDETSRVIRRTLMRYLTLGSLIVLQATSVSVKKRFPTMDHIFEAGVVWFSVSRLHRLVLPLFSRSGQVS